MLIPVRQLLLHCPKWHSTGKVIMWDPPGSSWGPVVPPTPLDPAAQRYGQPYFVCVTFWSASTSSAWKFNYFVPSTIDSLHLKYQSGFFILTGS